MPFLQEEVRVVLNNQNVLRQLYQPKVFRSSTSMKLTVLDANLVDFLLSFTKHSCTRGILAYRNSVHHVRSIQSQRRDWIAVEQPYFFEPLTLASQFSRISSRTSARMPSASIRTGTGMTPKGEAATKADGYVQSSVRIESPSINSFQSDLRSAIHLRISLTVAKCNNHFIPPISVARVQKGLGSRQIWFVYPHREFLDELLQLDHPKRSTCRRNQRLVAPNGFDQIGAYYIEVQLKVEHLPVPQMKILGY